MANLSSRRLLLAAVPTVPLVCDRILRMSALKEKVGLSRATIYRRIDNKEFPQAVSLGGQSVGWRESEIDAWIAARAVGGEA